MKEQFSFHHFYFLNFETRFSFILPDELSMFFFSKLKQLNAIKTFKLAY